MLRRRREGQPLGSGASAGAGPSRPETGSLDGPGVMRIVFSRKGFDSSFGGCPSPILDGVPVSLPIPTGAPTATRFGDLPAPLPALVRDLTRGRLGADDPCHVDPDIHPGLLRRRPSGWRGAFGQIGAAQAHLANQGVGPGDLFLFLGLFQPVALESGRWRYRGRAVHALYGWLQVESVHRVGEDPGAVLREHPWLERHAHARTGWPSSNTIYIARERLAQRPAVPGSGVFRRPEVLSDPDAAQKSVWRIPAWLDRPTGGTGLTYHAEEARWLGDGRLRAAPRGQEFVARLDGARAAEALDWALALIERCRA